MQTNKSRKYVLAARDAQSPTDIQAKSCHISRNLQELAGFNGADVLMFYINFRSEVETRAAITSCMQRGQHIAVPLTMQEDSKLIPYELQDMEKDLVPGYCSIPEPDSTRLPLVDPATIDLVIVPGSVFDERGGRLGYGGGFYDRFLQYEAPQAIRIGLAFELQVRERITLAPHDQLLDYLVTEKQIRHFCRK